MSDTLMSEGSRKRAATSPLSSEFEKKSRLGLTDDELQYLNENLCDWVSDHSALLNPEDISARVLAQTFQQIALHVSLHVLAKGHASAIDKSWTSVKYGEARINLLSLEDKIQLASLWVQARETGDWERFSSHSLLQVEPPSPDSDKTRGYARFREDQEEATERSWECTFQGDAATGLWEHIETHYNPSDVKVYAHFAAIVQSSGMGKSRTVDELAKDRFTIPLNLRGATSSGYPPADHSVREYLTSPSSKDVAYDRASAFLEALFDHTANTLDKILDTSDSPKYVDYAREFRLRMTEGQKMTGHNKFREEFHKEVVEKAKQLEAKRAQSVKHQASSKRKVSGGPPNSTPARSKDFPPYIAFQRLDLLLRTPPDSPSAKGKKKARPHKNIPLVILSFDEAHTTTQRQQAVGEEWSVFNELRHALRRLHSLPLFSLFLSTTGKISQFTSAVDEDLSKRVIEGKLVIIQPYTDLGFDPLANIIDLEGSWDLDRLTDDSQICSLGRPLFASRCLEGSGTVKREIILFAVAKLLNTEDMPPILSNTQVLACLSQRLPIEFNSTNYLSQEKERAQVEGHMRVCLNIDAAFETMTTTSSSEPILSEAAYFIMQRGSLSAPKALKTVMEGFSISKGDRGEFLVLLLLILARDATVGPPNELGRPINGKRWFGLADFLYGQVFQDGSPLLDQKSLRALRMLRKDFPNAHLHFSHFVKVHEYRAIDLNSLLLLQGRGAAVLCANNQTAIDCINVFLKDGTKLVRENAGLTFYQVKNNPKYSTNPWPTTFTAMDPYELGVLEESDPAVPLIKIVFALAARKASLNVVRRSPTKDYPAVVYEIWCAGLSPDVLGPIIPQETGIWDSLLQASYGWKELYKTTSKATATLRQSATPGAARDAGHYCRWAKRPPSPT